MVGPFCESSIDSIIVSESPLQLGPTLGQSLDLLFLRLFSMSIPAVLSDRNNYESEFTVGWQPHPSPDSLSSCWRWTL